MQLYALMHRCFQRAFLETKRSMGLRRIEKVPISLIPENYT